MSGDSVHSSSNAKQPVGASFSFFSSSNLLPTEIISKIFLEGTQTWQHRDPLSLPFPTAVAGVCTRWRMVAEDMPELWTFILPPLHKGAVECVKWTSKWLKLSRPKLLPVSIVLDITIVTEDFEGEVAFEIDQTIARLLSFLLDHVHRLRRLDIRSASADVFKKFVRHLGPRAINLEQLSLCALEVTVMPESTSSFLIFDRFHPSEWITLRNIRSLKKFRFQPDIAVPCISTLTSITVHYFFTHYGGMRDLFSNAPHLAHFVWHDVCLTEFQDDLTPIPAPSLRSIAVETTKSYYDRLQRSQESLDQSYFSLLSRLIIPNLEYLEVQGECRCDLVFDSSLSKSLGTIKKLRIANMERTDNSEFFRSFYALEELEIVQGPALELLSRSEASSLYDMNTSQVVWPHLRSITLDTADLNTFLSTIDFIEMRAGHPHFKIQHLSLSASSMRLLIEGDETSEDHANFTRRFEGKGGKEWLSKLVVLRSLEYPCYGLLDAERVPMAEML